MAVKQLLFNDDVRNKLFDGVKKVADAVVTTLGPKGQNVAITRPWGVPVVLHDGVSVAKEIILEDRFEDIGAQLVKEAASKTNDVAGDGTTTSTLLAYFLVVEGMKKILEGHNPMLMKSGMQAACKVVIDRINEMATPVKESEWERVASLSAQNPIIGARVAEAFRLVGKDGVIQIEEGKTAEIEINHRQGMSLERGYASPYLVNNPETMEVKMANPAILIIGDKIGAISDLLPFFEQFMQQARDLVILCEDIDAQALGQLINNKLKGIVSVSVVKAPGFGEKKRATMEDIAILTGATFISRDVGRDIKTASLKDLGAADSVTSTKDETLFVGGKGSVEAVNNRLEQIETMIKNTHTPYDLDKLQERKAKLTGGVAVIEVGADTEVEMTELIERVKDAKEALAAAIKSGIVPGGGVTFMAIRSELSALKKTFSEQDDILQGFVCVGNVLHRPLWQLAINSGASGDEIVNAVLEKKTPNYGFNALTGELGDLVEMGVIEPALVQTEAIKNAVSVAAMILTTACLITDVPEKELR